MGFSSAGRRAGEGAAGEGGGETERAAQSTLSQRQVEGVQSGYGERGTVRCLAQMWAQKLAVSSNPGPPCGHEAWGLLALFLRLVPGARFRGLFGPVSPVQSGDHDSVYSLRFLARPGSDGDSHGFRLARSLVPSEGGPRSQ